MDADFKLILTSVIIILIFIFYWYYKKFLAVYSQFPSYHVDFKIIYCLLTRKYPKNIPLTSFAFREVCTKLKEFYPEGVCVVWAFTPRLFIFGEDIVKTISQEEEALDKPFAYKVLEDGFGAGLITSNGDTWKAHRKMLDPAFRLRMLKKRIPTFNKYASAMVKRLADAVKEPSVNMEDYILPCSLNIISELMGNINMDGEYGADIREAHSHVQKLSRLSIYRMFNPFLYWKFFMNFSAAGRRYLRDYERADILPIKALMEIKETYMKSRAIEKLEENSDSLKSVAQMLFDIHLKDSNFTTRNILDEIKTFFSAGYHTIVTAVVWCIFMLGLHQDMQEQVYSEMKSLVDKDVTYEDLIQLTYLDCFIKETLRLYPPVPVYGRLLNKDIKYGKYEFPKGTSVFFCPYVYHRNPDLHPDPERFDPDRFREGNPENHPWTHIAFAEGIRNCIGKRFALLEMKVILVHILTKFKVTALDRSEDEYFDWGVVMKNLKPLRTKLSPRC